MRSDHLTSHGDPISVSTDRVDAYLRVLGALMLRDMRTRFFGSYWGYLVQVLWPVAHMLIITGAMVFRKQPPPFGDSIMIFATSGAVPALVFQYISREMMKGILINKPLIYYPQVKTLDVMLSRAIVEVISSFIGLMIIFLVLIAFKTDPIPVDKVTALGGYVAAICLGVGLGTINCAIIQFFPGWLLAYFGVTILLYLTSGVFFLANDLPTEVYQYLKYNPLVQLVEWVRLGYDPSLPVHVDYMYIFLWILGSLSVGLFTERTVSRRMA